MKTACILVGGLGTRLRALYADRPKALVPVNSRPFIAYMITDLIDQGVTHLHLAAGYRAGQLRDWAASTIFPGARITVSVEPEPLGTGGGLRFALPFCDDADPLLVLNGDSLLPRARLEELVAAKGVFPGCRGVLAAVEMTERGDYGTLDIDPQNRITAFREKATNDSGWVNGGIYYLDRDLIATLPEGQPSSIEKDVFPRLAANGVLGAYKVAGPLLDMGTPAGLQRTENYLAET